MVYDFKSENAGGLIIIKSVLTSVIVTLCVVASFGVVFQDELAHFLREDTVEVPSSASDVFSVDQTVPNIVAAAIPAVVSVVITAEVPVIEQYFQEFSPFGLFGQGFQVPRQRQVGTKEQQVGAGSGFFVSRDGYIVTNKHVVDMEDATYSIVTNEGITYDVEVVAKDPVLDIAILKTTKSSNFPYLSFGNFTDARLGEPVIAIGNALAEFPNSVSVGVISGLSRNIVAGDGLTFSESLEGLIQTDAAINRGNSGGPLLDSSGEVIGVNVAVAGGSENIGFALPGDVVSQVYQSVAEYGEIIRPFLGVRYTTITQEVVDEYSLSVTEGALVLPAASSEASVVPGSPADQAGIKAGDVLVNIAGEPLTNTARLGILLRKYSVGDTVEITLVRDGETRQVSLTLAKAPDDV